VISGAYQLKDKTCIIILEVALHFDVEVDIDTDRCTMDFHAENESVAEDIANELARRLN